MSYQDPFSNYLQELRRFLEQRLNQKSSYFCSLERTFEDNSGLIGREVFGSQVDLTDLSQVLHGYDGRLLLLGEPGGGKTISLIEFAIKKINERLENPNSLLPIFATIYPWTEIYNRQKAKSKDTVIDWLAQKAKIDSTEIQRELEQKSKDNLIQELAKKTKIDKEFIQNKLKQETNKDIILNFLAEQTNIERESLRNKIREQKVLLLLDGLDELPFNVSENAQDPNATREDYRAKFIESLIIPELQQVAMVVTCRRRDYEDITNNTGNNPLKLNGALVLNRLSEGKIEKYLNFIFQDNQESGELLWNLLNSSKDLLNMVRTPFLLDTLVSIYRDRESEHEAQQFTKVGTHEQLFDKFIEQGFTREKNKKEQRSQQQLPCNSSEELQDKLGEIAVVMMSDSEPDDNEIGNDILKRVIPQNNIRAFIELARNIQLLFNTSESNIYCFRHLLLRDYFAFRYSNKFLQNIVVQHNNSISKIEVVKAIGKLDKQRAVELLTGVLNNKNEDKDIRYEAANSLGQFSSRVYFRGYRQTFGNEHVISYSLSKFSSDETRDYFRQFVPERRIESEDINKIDTISRGIPLAVNIAATMWRKGISLDDIVSKKGDSHAEIVATACERFLTHFSKSEDSKEDLRAVYILAMMRHSDDEFLQKILNHKDLKSRGKELYSRYSFVSPQLRLDSQHKLLFKQFLLDKQRNHPNDPNHLLVNEISREARIYLENCFQKVSGSRLSESFTISAEQWINNPQNREIISDWVYYWFWESEQEGWNHLIPYLIKGWFYNLDWTRSLLEIPSQFTSTRKNSDLLRLFKWGLPPSENRTSGKEDQSLLLDELEKLTNHKLEDRECISIVLLKRGDLLFEQRKYQEAQEKYKQAKNYIPPLAETLRNKLILSEQKLEVYIQEEDKTQNKLLDVLTIIANKLPENTGTQSLEKTDNPDAEKLVESSEDKTPNSDDKNPCSEKEQNPPNQPGNDDKKSVDWEGKIKINYIFILGIIGFLLFILGLLLGFSISSNKNVLLWLIVGFLSGILIGNDNMRESFTSFFKSLYNQIKPMKEEEAGGQGTGDRGQRTGDRGQRTGDR